MMRGEKARDFKGTMRKLIEYLGTYRLSILIVLIFAVASTAASISAPGLTPTFVTSCDASVAQKIDVPATARYATPVSSAE